MRFTWLSNALWSSTGYGVQTRLFVPRLKNLGHEPAIIAFYGLRGGVINIMGIPTFPGGWDEYGNDVMSAHTLAFGAQVCISLMDIWVIHPSSIDTRVKWIPWFPIDHDPIPPDVLRMASLAHERIVFSRFAERQMQNAGLNSFYVPHGVETNVYRPIDKGEAKKQMGIDKDAFVIGMVAMNKGNPSRKCFVQQIEAFSRFKKRHSDAVMVLHTWMAEHGEAGGVNLPQLFYDFGLEVGKDVMVAEPYKVLFGMAPDLMNVFYNSLDILTSVSMGEGFGVPILEAQSAGVPVVAGDWTSMSELVFAGWKVRKEEAQPWRTPLRSYQFDPKVEAILDRYEQAYNLRGNADYATRAREGALGYDVDRVTEKYWKPTLAEIEAGLHG